MLPIMPQTPRKKVDAQHTLARVRTNQRRCRARKREYITGLEKKIETLETQCAQNDSRDQQNTVERLENENRKLRGLLNDAGFSEAWVETHLKEDNSVEAHDIWQDIGEQSLSRADGGINSYLGVEHENMVTELVPSTYGTVSQPPFSDLFDMPLFPLLGNQFDLFGPSLTLPPPESPLPQPLDQTPSKSQPPPTLSKPPKPSSLSKPCCSSPTSKHDPSYTSPPTTNTSLTFLKSTQSKDDLTLCTVAYELVRQHNKKDIDMIEIGIRLWNGFVKGDEDGGCKVQNKFLFSVLEYISD